MSIVGMCARFDPDVQIRITFLAQSLGCTFGMMPYDRIRGRRVKGMFIPLPNHSLNFLPLRPRLLPTQLPRRKRIPNPNPPPQRRDPRGEKSRMPLHEADYPSDHSDDEDKKFADHSDDEAKKVAQSDEYEIDLVHGGKRRWSGWSGSRRPAVQTLRISTGVWTYIA